jgi:hypothetical protein
MPKKRTSLDGLFVTEVEAKKTSTITVPPSSKNDSRIKTSIYLPEAVYEQLRSLAFDERHKMHDYFIEGLDLIFKKRGLKSVAELTQESE